MKVIRIDTAVSTVTFPIKAHARYALAIARAWLKRREFIMGGSDTVLVSIAVVGGRWHKIGRIGNRK